MWLTTARTYRRFGSLVTMAGIYDCCASPWTCRLYLSLFITRRNFILVVGFLVPSFVSHSFGSFHWGRESISAMRLGPPVHSASSWFINQTTIHSFIPPPQFHLPSHTMDQYTNYLDALSKTIYSQQSDPNSAFLSPDSHPPSLSASPVSSEGSDSLVDEAMRYGLFGYDPSPMVTYNPFYQKYVLLVSISPDISPDGPSTFSSMGDIAAGSTPTNDPSTPSAVVKHEDTFSCDYQMVLDGSITTPLSPYQHFTGYPSQERNPMAFDYLAHENSSGSLANALVDSPPFITVAPSATSGLPDEDTSAYDLSTPVSSPLYHAPSLGYSPVSLPISQPQQIQVCDPKALDSPLTVEQQAMQAGPSIPAGGRRRGKALSYRASAADSDYSPSGESEVEDTNDHCWGESVNRKKTRSTRATHVAHPVLNLVGKAKSNKRRGTKLEIPVPTPGLTKNSRGRCVPRKAEGVFEDASRPFWCPVKDCDKMFNRGEHLKRHVLSIHTQNTREALPSHFLISAC